VNGERRLLARLVAADILLVHHHPGRHLEHDPWVSRRRNAFEVLAVERLAGLYRGGVDDRAFARDGDRLLDRGDLELRVDLGGEADLDADAVTDERLEPAQLEAHRVDADGNVRETVRARLARRRRLRREQRRAFDGDHRAGQNAAAMIRDLAEDLARLRLCVGGRSDRERKREYKRS
jgi:hypothetical protein